MVWPQKRNGDPLERLGNDRTGDPARTARGQASRHGTATPGRLPCPAGGRPLAQRARRGPVRGDCEGGRRRRDASPQRRARLRAHTARRGERRRVMVLCDGSCGHRTFRNSGSQLWQRRPPEGVERQPILGRYRPALDPPANGRDGHVPEKQLHGCRSAGVLDDLIMSSHGGMLRFVLRLSNAKCITLTHREQHGICM